MVEVNNENGEGPEEFIEEFLDFFNRVEQKQAQKSWGDPESKGKEAKDPIGNELGKDVCAAVHKDAPGE